MEKTEKNEPAERRRDPLCLYTPGAGDELNLVSIVGSLMTRQTARLLVAVQEERIPVL